MSQNNIKAPEGRPNFLSIGDRLVALGSYALVGALGGASLAGETVGGTTPTIVGAVIGVLVSLACGDRVERRAGQASNIPPSRQQG